MTADHTPYLELRGVSLVRDKVCLLTDVNFAVYPGTFHVVLGANGAGKTNLLRLLAGIYTPETGDFYVQGEKCVLNPTLAASRKIAFCGQEFELFDDLTVLDNFFIGYQSQQSFWFSRKKLRVQLERFFAEYGLSFGLDWPASRLKLAEKCQLQIARALFFEPSVLLVDEFEAVLNRSEIEQIFHALEHARSRGCAVVLATHTMSSALTHVDYVTALESGRARTIPVASGAEPPELSALIRRNGYTNIPKRPITLGKTLIQAEDLSTARISNVSFSLRQGEILGIYGLCGSGRSSFLETVARLHPLTGGWLRFYPDASHVKIGYLPEDGTVFHNISLPQNVTITNLNAVKHSTVLIDTEQERIVYNDYAKRLGIRAETANAAKLSKGNQQKLMLARCLHGRCNVYLLDNPTSSVDSVGKLELYNILGELAHQGAGIIMVSSDLGELHRLCDRILLFSKGQVIRCFSPPVDSLEEICRFLD